LFSDMSFAVILYCPVKEKFWILDFGFRIGGISENFGFWISDFGLMESLRSIELKKDRIP